MGFFKRLFNKKEDIKPAVKERTIHNLKVNDIVEYDLETYEVIGIIGYNDSGYKWACYHLKGEKKNIWLNVEVDDELELGIYEKIKIPVSEPFKNEIDIDGTIYYLDEKSTARIEKVDGQAGAAENQSVEYYDYESDDETYLSIEKWGGDIEASKGYSIEEYEIKIIAGS